MATAINSIADEAKIANRQPAALMINRVVEVDKNGTCQHYDYP